MFVNNSFFCASSKVIVVTFKYIVNRKIKWQSLILSNCMPKSKCQEKLFLSTMDADNLFESLRENLIVIYIILYSCTANNTLPLTERDIRTFKERPVTT